tara:strand:+ start:843 stop:1238 length:396 start_codon:yes stop_codon:yes gene_type:complete
MHFSLSISSFERGGSRFLVIGTPPTRLCASGADKGALFFFSVSWRALVIANRLRGFGVLICPLQEELPEDVKTVARSVMFSKALDTVAFVVSRSVILYFDVQDALTNTLYGCTSGADPVTGADTGATILDH